MQKFKVLQKMVSQNEMDQILRQVAAKGILKHAVDQKYGGLGSKFEDLVEAHKSLGKSSLNPSLILSMNAHLWGAVFPIYYYGTDEQKAVYLKSLVEGKYIGGHAITESQAGSNVSLMETRAISSEDSFVINGSKIYISNAPILDVMVVYAKLEQGISALIVAKNDHGVSIKDSPVTGFPGSPIGEVTYHNCKIPKTRLLGNPGSGQMMIQKVLELERAFIFAGLLGIMQWQLDEVINYTKRRKINQHSSTFDVQAVSHKIAEISMRLRIIDMWLQKCAKLKDENKRISLESAYTKLFASEAFLQSSIEIARMFGAFGLQIDQPFSQFVLDGLASTLFSGTSEIQKNIISLLI